MAIQNQGFRRDLNLKETEDDRTAFDNLAGSGTSKDISFLLIFPIIHLIFTL